MAGTNLTALDDLGASAKRSYAWSKENGHKNGDAYVLACQVEEFAKEIDRLRKHLADITTLDGEGARHTAACALRGDPA